MKYFTGFACIALLFSFNSIFINGQTHILLDENFQSVSEQMPAKRKGIGAIGKYEFGPYRIVSGKESWTTTKSKTGFFSGDTRIESKTRKSFVFTGPDSDTVIANISVSSALETNERYGFLFRTLTDWSYEEITESHESYIATFESSEDTGIWNLVLVYPVTDEISGAINADLINQFRGSLSGNETVITVEPVIQWDNGQKSSLLKPVEGYRFILNGSTVAAVQVYPANKISVWIRSDLNNGLRMILASSAAAIMVRSF